MAKNTPAATETTPPAVPPVAPVAPAADALAALSLPPPLDAQMQAKRSAWKIERRTKCRAHKDCYYPLNFKRGKNNELVEVDTPEGKAFLAECSWDPTHKNPDGTEQYILLESLRPPEEEN